MPKQSVHVDEKGKSSRYVVRGEKEPLASELPVFKDDEFLQSGVLIGS